MPPAAPAVDFDDLWADVEMEITGVYEKTTISRIQHMALYTKMYNICSQISRMHTRLERDESGRLKKKHFDANRELYGNIKRTVVAHVRSKMELGKEKRGDEILLHFSSAWKDFRLSTRVLNGMFSSLNRHFIRREMELLHDDVVPINQLSLITWYDTFVSELRDDVFRCVHNLIEKSRTGENIVNDLILDVFNCLAEMRDELSGDDPHSLRHILGEDPHPLGAVARMQLCNDISSFEDNFLRETGIYYISGCADLFQNYSFSVFMKRVECLLNEEKRRCEVYFLGVLSKVPESLGMVIISPQLHLFYDETGDLLKNDKYDDLGRMYRICRVVDGGLGELRKAFEGLVLKKGLAAIEAVSEQVDQNANLFVEAIVSVLKHYEKMAKSCFQCDSEFMDALGRAASVFVNNNAVTKKPKGGKCVDILSRHIDSLLRKSSRNIGDEELELLLRDASNVVIYVENRDRFQNIYTGMFYKRLITDSSVSEHAEQTMIKFLSEFSGFEFTDKLHQIFTDISISKELTYEFRNVCKNEKKIDIGFDFSMKVLAMSCSTTNSMIRVMLPMQMGIAMGEFSALYINKHPSRHLTWIHSQGRGVLTSSGFSKKYTFIASTPQMTVLLLFNERTEFTLDALKKNLEMDKEQLVSVLESLLKNDIVVSEHITSGEEYNATSGDAVFKLNMNFSNKKLKVDLSKTVEQKSGSEEVNNDRNMAIQIAIMRIMKSRKIITHSALIEEILSLLTYHFKLRIPMIKHCIDVLIEKECLKRKENEKDTYEYIA